jgi:Amino acid synthesis
MIRKLLTIVEETHREAGEEIKPPTRKAAAIAVVENPFAGRHAEHLDELIALGEMLGGLLGERAVRALGIQPGQAQSYGKAAIVGEDGELEHAAAILHPKLGAPLRAAVEKGAALVPSAKKRGGMGAAIDVPLGHKDAAFVRSHFDAMEVRVPDAPRRDEIVVAVVVTDSGRPLPRIGGLKVEEIVGKDGLR